MNWTNATANLGPGIERATLIAGRSPVVAVLCIGLLISIATSSTQLLNLSWASQWPYFIAIGIALLGLFELVRNLATRPTPLPVVPFVTGTLLLGLALRGAYVSHIQPEWYTDFLRYWTVGVDLAKSDAPQIANIYSQRANFLTRPLIEVFGEDRRIIPAANVFLLTAIQLLGYDIVRRARSHQAAQAFSLLWLLSPEPLMTAAVPNHDLAGLFLLSVALWLALAGIDRLKHGHAYQAVLFGAAIGVVLSLLESVRGLGNLALLVLGLMTSAVALICLSRHRTLKPALTMIIGLFVVALSFISSDAVLEATGSIMSKDAKQANMLRYTTPHSTSLSDGTHNFMHGFTSTFTNDIYDSKELSYLRKSIVLSDYQQDPINRIRASAAKMGRQYSLASQRSFYLRNVDASTVQQVAAFTNFFVILFSSFLLLSIYLLLGRRITAPSLDHFLLLLIACSSLVLLLIGENQPRYLSMIWLAGAIVIATQLSLTTPLEPPHPSPVAVLATSITFFLTMALVVWLALAVTYKPANGRILDDWAFRSDSSDPKTARIFLQDLQSKKSNVIIGKRERSIPTDFGKLSLKLMLPSTPSESRFAQAEQRVCGINRVSRLEFQYDSPAKRLIGRDAYELQVLMDDNAIWQTMLPNAEKPEKVRVPIPATGDGCVNIKYRVIAHNQSHLVSWQRASFVEIFFARIVTSSPH